jgi:hypothetical protein
VGTCSPRCFDGPSMELGRGRVALIWGRALHVVDPCLDNGYSPIREATRNTFVVSCQGTSNGDVALFLYTVYLSGFWHIYGVGLGVWSISDSDMYLGIWNAILRIRLSGALKGGNSKHSCIEAII